MNTLNPAAEAALEQDGKRLLDATWEYHRLAGPNWERVNDLLQQEGSEDLNGPEVKEIMQLLNVTDTLELIRRTMDIFVAHTKISAAEESYVKTRRLLSSIDYPAN